MEAEIPTGSEARRFASPWRRNGSPPQPLVPRPQHSGRPRESTHGTQNGRSERNVGYSESVNPPTSQLTQQRGDQGKATAHERTDRQRAGKQEKRRGHRSALGKALRNSPGFIPTAQETPVTMVGKGSGDISTDPTEVERTIGESHEC